jgi:chemotaxis protein methyltransferase CheR
MRFSLETLNLPENTFLLLRDLIHDRLGLFYDVEKRDWVAHRLSPQVLERGLSSFLDYYFLLKYDASADDEWANVMNALSVQETYFWREMDQVRALVDVLVPQYYAAPRARPLRIWSAACATGEEPLTIAMALQEAGWFDRAAIEIYASDASAAAIEKAKQGLFRERAFRSLAPALRAKYFTEEQGLWRVSPTLHSRIHWSTANLMSEAEIAPLAKDATIFCRNAFIYFSTSATRKIVEQFWKYMATPGYLFVGAAESLLRVTSHFELQEIGGAFVYVKSCTS